MTRFGLNTIVINSDTRAEAKKSGRDLWVEARTGYTMVLNSPEELTTRGFGQLLDQKAFSDRVCMLGVDEVHLLYWWGRAFRPAFRQIGNLCARLLISGRRRVPLIATTATLRVGPTMDAVSKILGLVPGRYHLIRRSNMRHDIQIIFRELRSGLGSYSFPELDWILDEGDNTVLFCKTIALGFRVASYLWRLAKSKGMSQMDKRIRLYNSLNWPSYNSDTLGFLNNNQQSSVTIATDTLSVGWDSQYTRNAVLIGEPDDVDEFVQKIGRIGRNRKAVSHPRAFLYHTKGAVAKARAIVEKFKSQEGQNALQKADSEDKMDGSMARLLIAPCISHELDVLFNNPTEDDKCQCCSCHNDPPPQRRPKCNCSAYGCEPEIMEDTRTTTQVPSIPGRARARPGETMPKELREHGTKRFKEFRWHIFEQADDRTHGALPLEAFFPQDVMKTVLDNFYAINKLADLGPLIHETYLLNNHHQRLFDLCVDLRHEFHEIRLNKKHEAGQLRALSKSGAEIGEIDAEDILMVTNDTDDELEVQGHSIKWKINFLCEFFSSNKFIRNELI
jgi:hypothetical protein